MSANSEILGPEKVIDKAGSLERLGGDEDLYKEVCEIFVTDSKNNIERLKTVLSNKDQEDSTRRLHSLKGAAANIGGVKLSRIAGELEILAREGKLLEIEDKYEVLKESLEELLEEL